MGKQFPTLEQEHALLRAGHVCVAGLDEAGRGAWAGPVAAAAVILPLADPALPERLRGVCDSKLCTPRQRAILYGAICEAALAWAVSFVPAAQIDAIGIVPATRLAMQEAIARLAPAPGALLIDYLTLPDVRLPQRALAKGELKSLSIAAASIVAKVSRDREMIAMEEACPGYGFARHKGYGTREHRAALQRLGARPGIHRQSFAPISALAVPVPPGSAVNTS